MMIQTIRAALSRAVLATSLIVAGGGDVSSLSAQRLQVAGIGFTHPPDMLFSDNTSVQGGLRLSRLTAMGTSMTALESEVRLIGFFQHSRRHRRPLELGVGLQLFHQQLWAGNSGSLLHLQETYLLPTLAANFRGQESSFLLMVGAAFSHLGHRFGDSTQLHSDEHTPFLEDTFGGADYNPASPLFPERYLAHDSLYVKGPTICVVGQMTHDQWVLGGELQLYQDRSTVFLPHDLPRSTPEGILWQLYVVWGRGDNNGWSNNFSFQASLSRMISLEEPSSGLAGSMRLFVNPHWVGTGWKRGGTWHTDPFRLLLGAGVDQGQKSLQLRRRPGSPLLQGVNPVMRNVLRLEVGFEKRFDAAVLTVVLEKGFSLGKQIPIYQQQRAYRQVGHQLQPYTFPVRVGNVHFHRSIALSITAKLLN